jgi:hypothetical protein
MHLILQGPDMVSYVMLNIFLGKKAPDYDPGITA